jgi:hypothetical protein
MPIGLKRKMVSSEREKSKEIKGEKDQKTKKPKRRYYEKRTRDESEDFERFVGWVKSKGRRPDGVLTAVRCAGKICFFFANGVLWWPSAPCCTLTPEVLADVRMVISDGQSCRCRRPCCQ